ncbi:MAG TPA: carboxypeptidase regulatory-like domain-containing protein, partial [Gemmata sp.]
IKDAERWKPFGPVTFEDVRIDPDARGIANLMVWLRPDSDDPKADIPAHRVHPNLRHPAPKEHPVLAVAAQFRPRVLAVRAGDTLSFENRLQVPTNVYYSAPDADSERGFNLLLGHDMAHASKPLPADRAPDVFQSSVHNWMRGYVRAFDHPYFAVTGANGRFELRDVPAGTWRLVVWHEAVGYLGGAAGRLGAKVTVPENRTGKHELGPIEFKSDRWPAP